MAQKEQLTENIKYLTELLKIFWLTLVALIGGSVGLILGEFGFRRVAIGISIAVAGALLLVVTYVHRQIRLSIRKLEEV